MLELPQSGISAITLLKVLLLTAHIKKIQKFLYIPAKQIISTGATDFTIRFHIFKNI